MATMIDALAYSQLMEMSHGYCPSSPMSAANSPCSMGNVNLGPILSTGSSVVAHAQLQPELRTPQDTRSSWRLVWCSERCHKTENERTRKMLAEASREAGGMLVCLKKAARYSAWLSHQPRPPFVLLADWREAKPCLDVMAMKEGPSRPILTVVFAESARVFERATAWVEGLKLQGSNHPIIVVQDITNSHALIADILRHVQVHAEPFMPSIDKVNACNLLQAQLPPFCGISDTATTASRSGCATPTTLGLKRVDSAASTNLMMLTPCSGTMSSSAGSLTPTYQGLHHVESAASSCHVESAASSFHVEGAASPFFPVEDEPEEIPWMPCPRVKRVLSGLLNGQDVSEVQNLLEQAMPDHYDD